MNLPLIKDFFANKVTIQLKNGHKFEGLLSQVNYKNNSVMLEDVQDLGNNTDRNFIPHDRKITEKVFESDNIEEIIFKEKHFCEPKKYKKDQFWDSISQPVEQQSKKQRNYEQNDKPYYQKRNYDNKQRRGGNRQTYEGNRQTYGGNRNNYGNNRDNTQSRGQNRGEYRGGRGNYNRDYRDNRDNRDKRDNRDNRDKRYNNEKERNQHQKEQANQRRQVQRENPTQNKEEDQDRLFR